MERRAGEGVRLLATRSDNSILELVPELLELVPELLTKLAIGRVQMSRRKQEEHNRIFLWGTVGAMCDSEPRDVFVDVDISSLNEGNVQGEVFDVIGEKVIDDPLKVFIPWNDIRNLVGLTALTPGSTTLTPIILSNHMMAGWAALTPSNLKIDYKNGCMYNLSLIHI